MSERKRDYEVGYGLPPKHTQFKKGQSGNRNGRPRGRKNTTDVLMKELAARVTVGEGGVQRRMSMVEVIIKQLVNRAAKGDHKALQAIVLLERAAETARVARGTNDWQHKYSDEDDLRMIQKMLGLDHDASATLEPAAEPVAPAAPPTEPENRDGSP